MAGAGPEYSLEQATAPGATLYCSSIGALLVLYCFPCSFPGFRERIWTVFGVLSRLIHILFTDNLTLATPSWFHQTANGRDPLTGDCGGRGCFAVSVLGAGADMASTVLCRNDASSKSA
jgi:hypothetical protein